MSRERTATIHFAPARWPLGREPISVWGYDKRGHCVCRLQINSAGVAVYGGKRGTKRLADVNWEGLVKRLTGAKHR